jgi:hypothetical protein
MILDTVIGTYVHIGHEPFTGRCQDGHLCIVDDAIRRGRDQNAICPWQGGVRIRRWWSTAGLSAAAGDNDKESKNQDDGLHSQFTRRIKKNEYRTEGESKAPHGGEPAAGIFAGHWSKFCGCAGDGGGDLIGGTSCDWSVSGDSFLAYLDDIATTEPVAEEGFRLQINSPHNWITGSLGHPLGLKELPVRSVKCTLSAQTVVISPSNVA